MADAPPLALSRPYEAQERDLKDRFPDEGDAIEAWIASFAVQPMGASISGGAAGPNSSIKWQVTMALSEKPESLNAA